MALRYIKSTELWTVPTASPVVWPTGGGAHIYFNNTNGLTSDALNVEDQYLLGPIINEEGRADICLIEMSGQFVAGGTNGANPSSFNVHVFGVPERGVSLHDTLYITNTHPAEVSTFVMSRLTIDGPMADSLVAPVQGASSVLGLSGSYGALNRSFPWPQNGSVIANNAPFHMMFPIGMYHMGDCRISGIKRLMVGLKSVNGGAGITAGTPSIAGRILAHLYEES